MGTPSLTMERPIKDTVGTHTAAPSGNAGSLHPQGGLPHNKPLFLNHTHTTGGKNNVK